MARCGESQQRTHRHRPHVARRAQCHTFTPRSLLHAGVSLGCLHISVRAPRLRLRGGAPLPTSATLADAEEDAASTASSQAPSSKEGADGGLHVDVDLKPASQEQAAIVAAFVSGANVIVNAVAGSGKTTTILHVAKALPHRRILVLTYNARLKLATRAAIQHYGLRNVEAHSFHAAGAKFYAGHVSEHAADFRTDKGLMRLVKEPRPPSRALVLGGDPFDALVVDEAQDLKPLLFQVVQKLREDIGAGLGQEPQLLMLGDERQCIYGFQQADARYLTVASKALPSSLPWQTLPLRTSFRCTGSIAQFVNDAMIGFDLIHVPAGTLRGLPVQYLVGAPWNITRHVFDELMRGFQDASFAPSDVFVLAPSVRNNNTKSFTPLQDLENRLVNAGIPVYTSNTEEDELNSAVIEGKVVITTFHSSKGLERRVVVVDKFSDDYYKYYVKAKKEHDPQTWPERCPNTMYVAATRARERLYVIAEQYAGRHLPFVNRGLIQRQQARSRRSACPDPSARECRPIPETLGIYLDVEVENEEAGIEGVNVEEKVDPFVTVVDRGLLFKKKEWEKEKEFSTVSVTSLVRQVPDDLLEEAEGLARRLTAPQFNVEIPAFVSDEETGRIEAVSDITGTALPAMYQFHCCGRCSIQDNLESYVQEMVEKWGGLPKHVYDGVYTILKSTPRSPEDFLRLAVWDLSRKSGFLNKPAQNTSYEWLSWPAAQSCLSVLAEHLPKSNLQAVELPLYKMLDHPSIRVTGYVDAIADDALWELKCVEELKPEHILQLTVYAWLYEESCKERDAVDVPEASRVHLGVKEVEGVRVSRLLNVRTGMVLQLTVNSVEIENMVRKLLDAKYRSVRRSPDEQFLEDCRKLRAQVQKLESGCEH
ncbi:hypothetical protein CYMTET_42827 [Cymbomonas tetramitiformis]|uniref:UvrD-like helicase C-terminal domain-containing protein n=1 Tax=Cymbomonas tetramitiformis TaxID=36881 RepID=A0AAE0F150_9CHLO|nr:hypothetical protein CYMTET_42827 [Cymbomonas tetramitiformis]